MINFKNNKGVTLVMLVITIIVVLILAGITIDLSIDSINLTTENQDTSEMLMIQHAIQERYVECLETNNELLLVGTKVDLTITNKNNDDYYKYNLSTKENLEKLGVTGEGIKNFKFIINYKTGYVEKVGSSTPALQSYSNWEGKTTSNMIEIEE